MSKELSRAVEQRRSIYALDAAISIPPERVVAIVEHSVMWAPSAFNSQTARVVVLFGEQHQKLWNGTKEILRAIVPADAFAPTESKMNGFAAGAGTVLFFEDRAVITDLQGKFPSYADKFPLFSLQSSGMTQYIVWTALEAEGLGASLQHYSPLIDNLVQTEWKVPTTWQLNAQMVFGNPTAEPGPKTFAPLADRVFVHR